MTKKNIWLLTLIVCVFTLLLWSTRSFGYTIEMTTEKLDLEHKYQVVNDAETKLTKYKAALSTLVEKWAANESEIASGTEVTLGGVFGTTAAAFATALSKSTPITAVAGAFLTLRKAVDVGMAISASDDYVSAMETADGAVSSAVTEINAAYAAYTAQYNRYLSACAAHSLVRFSGNTQSAVYSKSALDDAVNKSDQQRGWYHSTDLSASGIDHFIALRWGSDHWDMTDAPRNYECKGTCTVAFRSPYSALMEHRKKCGTASSIDDWILAYTLSGGGGYATSVAMQTHLNSRTVGEGCGRTWYNCDSDHSTKEVTHQVRTCAKTYTNSNGSSSPCGVSYRNCMGWTRDHDESDIWPGKSEHSESESTTSGSTTSGSIISGSGSGSQPRCATGGYNLCNDAGGCSFQGSSTTAGACGQMWCLCRSDSSSNGDSSNGDSNNGESTTTQTTPTPTVQCANNYIGSGACKFNRVVTSSSTEHQATCSGGHTYWSCSLTATPHHQDRTCTRCSLSYQNCTNHSSACQNTRWHTQESDPYITGACGDTYRKSAAGSHDSIQCSDTTCTSRSYYECQSHTHTYSSSTGGSSNGGNTGSTPTVSCGRPACTETVSSSNEHRVGPCSACGSSYWTCGTYASWSEAQHRSRTCRRSSCRQTWQRCVSSAPTCLADATKSCWAE